MDTRYNLTKLLYCHHRFYGKQYMLNTVLYLLSKLTSELNRLRFQLRQVSPISPRTARELEEATDGLVQFISIELGIYEEHQKLLMERLAGNARNGSRIVTHEEFRSFVQSDGWELLSGASRWLEKKMNEADMVVEEHDEHRRGQCEYVENYIRENPLFIQLSNILEVVDPLIRASEEVEAVAELARIKNRLDSSAEAYAKRGLWLYLAALLLVWILLAALTWKLGWEVMEPIIYFAGGGITVGSYLYFVITQKELSPRTIYSQIVQARRHRNYRVLGFDLQAFQRLDRHTCTAASWPELASTSPVCRES